MKNKKIRRIKKFFDKHTTIIILSLIFFSMLILNFLTPLIADDYNYKYIWGTNSRVSNIIDVFISQYNHYLTWGGRSVAHFIAQIFLIFPKEIFNIFNSLCYTAIVYLIYYLATNKNKNPYLLLLIHFLIYFIVPYFGEDFLWLIGSCNYAWTLLIMLFFLSYYKKNSKNNSIINIILIFILGIIAGWTNENTAFGLSIIILLSLLEDKYRKIEIQKWKISGFVGILFGFIMMIAAPGNYVRQSIAEEKSSFLIKYIKRFINCTLGIKENLWIILIILLILFTYYMYKKIKPEIKVYNYIIGAFVSIYAMIMSPQFPPRAWLGIVIFTIIPTITLLDKIVIENRLIKYILFDVIIILSCLFLVDYFELSYDLKKYDDVLKYRQEYISKHRKETDTFTFAPYEITNKKSPIHGKDLDQDKNNWLNKAQAKYYNVKYIIGEE